jgi:hypothetical protein
MYKLVFVAALMLMGMLFVRCEDEKDTRPPVSFEVEVLAPEAVTKTNNTKLLVHYMPWFEMPESDPDNQWGIHWTMANQNPGQVGADGYPQVASHFNPLIGPYDSGDPDVVEYHLLLMKYAGIDGVLIDWYGTFDVNDYRANKENAEVLIDKLNEVGLQFAIVYEDRTLSQVVDAGLESGQVAAAIEDMSFLERDYFSRDEYITIEERPLLMVFGPINLQKEEDWSNAFSNLNQNPYFLTLWDQSVDAGSNADGEYAWVYSNNDHLKDFYANKVDVLKFWMGSAYPGFVDFYAEGGWSDDIGWEIPHNNGATLDETLQMATDAGVDYLQLVTWNDFGEGTMIEPTHEFEYEYLQKVKDFAGVSGEDSDFDLIYSLFEKRKQFQQNSMMQKKLNQVFYYLVSMQPGLASDMMEDIENESL